MKAGHSEMRTLEGQEKKKKKKEIEENIFNSAKCFHSVVKRF